MYHKVNDTPGEPADRAGRRCSTSRWRSSASSATRSVSLDACSTTTSTARRCRRRAVLITFDDGYRDNLENAVPVLEQARLPGGALRRRSATSTTRARCRTTSTSRARRPQPDARLGELAELEAAGVRVESHGIGHRPLADLEVDEAAREIALSKLRLEERLGRPVRAFAYVKGSEAHYRPST